MAQDDPFRLIAPAAPDETLLARAEGLCKAYDERDEPCERPATAGSLLCAACRRRYVALRRERRAARADDL